MYPVEKITLEITYCIYRQVEQALLLLSLQVDKVHTTNHYNYYQP